MEQTKVLTNMSEESRITDRHNMGLCILRMAMCFCVVLCHFWTVEDYWEILKPFRLFRDFAVPVFMMMSFMLTQKSFMKKDSASFNKRLWRLLIPQLGWAVIYWIVFNVAEYITGENITNGISDLLWQIFTGHSPRLNATMWYQTVLIVLSLIYFFIFTFIPQKIGIICIYIVMAVALVLQYSGINYSIFSGLRYELMYPLGRIAEMIPYATIGFSLSYYEIYKKLNRYRWPVILLSAIMGIILVVKPIFPKAMGFGYSGILGIFVAFMLITIAVLFPINDFLNEKLKKTVLVLTKYTLGIYCIHRLVEYMLTYVFGMQDMAEGTFIFCVLIYFISYVLSAIIAALPLKICKQLVE